jgi:pilus assembly protein CpaF
MMVMMAGFDLPVPVIRQYVSTAITLVVQLSRLKGGPRKIMRVSEIVGLKDRKYRVRDIYKFQQTGVQNGVAIGEFTATGYTPRLLAKLKASGLEMPAEMFAERILSVPGYQPPAAAAGWIDGVNETNVI